MSDLVPDSTQFPAERIDDDLALEPARGIPTEATLVLVLGTFYLLIGIVYVVTTGLSSTGVEYAGAAALLFGSAFSYFFGLFLAFRLRAIQYDVELQEGEVTTDEAHADSDGRAGGGLYLPSQSIWPIGIGIGLTLTLAGVAVGFWVLLPGLVLLLHSLVGFAHQSRTRS